MNNFDLTVLTFLSQIRLAPLLNHAIRVIVGLYTFKGFLLIPLLWWIWFQPSERIKWRREMVIATLASGLVALAAGRLLAHFLPFRIRPIYNPDLHLHFASAALREAKLSVWSSFPSDHAMLWTAISLGIFFVWRGVGTLALLYTALFICLPRAYLGFHYPTDLLGGAAIGVAITWVLTRDAVRTRFATPILHGAERFPGPASALAFMLCFELVTQFDELLMLLKSTTRVL